MDGRGSGPAACSAMQSCTSGPQSRATRGRRAWIGSAGTTWLSRRAGAVAGVRTLVARSALKVGRVPEDALQLVLIQARLAGLFCEGGKGTCGCTCLPVSGPGGECCISGRLSGQIEASVPERNAWPLAAACTHVLYGKPQAEAAPPFVPTCIMATCALLPSWLA
jgi:hypothetical protein